MSYQSCVWILDYLLTLLSYVRASHRVFIRFKFLIFSRKQSASCLTLCELPRQHLWLRSNHLATSWEMINHLSAVHLWNTAGGCSEGHGHRPSCVSCYYIDYISAIILCWTLRETKHAWSLCFNFRDCWRFWNCVLRKIFANVRNDWLRSTMFKHSRLWSQIILLRSCFIKVNFFQVGP